MAVSRLGDEGPRVPVMVGRVNDCNGAGARSSGSTGNEGVDSGQGFEKSGVKGEMRTLWEWQVVLENHFRRRRCRKQLACLTLAF